MRLIQLGLLLTLSYPCFAVLTPDNHGGSEFGWSPKYQGLWVKTGIDFFSTSQNYLSDGLTQDLVSNGETLTLSNTHIYVAPEYGFSEHWAAKLKANFVSNSVSGDRTGTNYLDGSGLSDIDLGVKYSLSPSLVGEIGIRIPTYSTTVTQLNSLLPGDGSLDFTVAAHFSGNLGQFFYAGSPTFTLRSAGYSPLLGAHAGFGTRLSPVYVMALVRFQTALGNSLLFDSVDDDHIAGGTGSSYALLSGSPSQLSLGLQAGIEIFKHYFLEVTFQKSVWGKRSPEFLQFGINLLAQFDFYKPDPRKKITEVPFDYR